MHATLVRALFDEYPRNGLTPPVIRISDAHTLCVDILNTPVSTTTIPGGAAGISTTTPKTDPIRNGSEPHYFTQTMDFFRRQQQAILEPGIQTELQRAGLYLDTPTDAHHLIERLDCEKPDVHLYDPPNHTGKVLSHSMWEILELLYCIAPTYPAEHATDGFPERNGSQDGVQVRRWLESLQRIMVLDSPQSGWSELISALPWLTVVQVPASHTEAVLLTQSFDPTQLDILWSPSSGTVFQIELLTLIKEGGACVWALPTQWQASDIHVMTLFRAHFAHCALVAPHYSGCPTRRMFLVAHQKRCVPSTSLEPWLPLLTSTTHIVLDEALFNAMLLFLRKYYRLLYRTQLRARWYQTWQPSRLPHTTNKSNSASDSTHDTVATFQHLWMSALGYVAGGPSSSNARPTASSPTLGYRASPQYAPTSPLHTPGSPVYATASPRYATAASPRYATASPLYNTAESPRYTAAASPRYATADTTDAQPHPTQLSLDSSFPEDQPMTPRSPLYLPHSPRSDTFYIPPAPPSPTYRLQ